MKKCILCRKPFEPPRYYPQKKLCSLECRNLDMARRNRETQRVNKPGGLTPGERGKIGLSRKLARQGTGYTKVNGVHEHRVVAEKVLGRKLKPGEVVHHEDLDRMNNDPSNLIVFPSQADHARHHKLKHLGSPCGCPGDRLGGDSYAQIDQHSG